MAPVSSMRTVTWPGEVPKSCAVMANFRGVASSSISRMSGSYMLPSASGVPRPLP